MEQLPERDAANVLSVKEVTDAVNSLKNGQNFLKNFADLFYFGYV